MVVKTLVAPIGADEKSKRIYFTPVDGVHAGFPSDAPLAALESRVASE